jgi:hypothetical protein
MEALAPPFDSLHDDRGLLASNVVDFTPVREVTVFEPSSKTWPNAIATRSVSLLKPPVHGDSFSDNSTAHAAVAVPCVHQSTTTPPRASHTVLGHRLQPSPTPRLPPAAYRQWRTRLRLSIPLRPPADPDPYTRPAVPTPLVVRYRHIRSPLRSHAHASTPAGTTVPFRDHHRTRTRTNVTRLRR